MSAPSSPTLRFTKMHGAGNDFVVVDCRDGTSVSTALAARLADRHRGIGCDQVLTVHPPQSDDAALTYAIWNTDGSAARQCGNGARCIAAWARRAGLAHGGTLLMDSPSGPVRAELLPSGEIAIELSAPDFEPARIPLIEPVERDAYSADVDGGTLTFGAVSMGNPHAVIEVDDVENAAVARIGARLQADARFPHSCNVGFAEVVSPQHIRLRVYERGVGETLACGSGACAAVSVLTRRGRVHGDVAVDLPGGRLHVTVPGDGAPVRMRGPAVFVFEGEFTP